MHLYSHREPKTVKTAAVVRYGAFGDALQASSVLPWLKEQGYHVTFYTVPSSYEVLKHDPHIDRFVVQDMDAIPNEHLGDFWTYTAKRYDKWINLSESVERTLLAMPGNMNFLWSHEMRHKHLNKNYIEFSHDIAGVPMPSRVKFYATEPEKAAAMAERARIGGHVIMWVLAGSAVHKLWPYIDEAMDIILSTHDDARFVLVGDKLCQGLEAGWENTPQVHLRSGKWTIRQALAFAQVCDLVVGPETGVLNAVSMEPVQKIVTLSHSSVENLTRGWRNCTSLWPAATSCYPCHMLHNANDGFAHCRESAPNSGIAACQADISAMSMVSAINNSFSDQRVAA